MVFSFVHIKFYCPVINTELMSRVFQHAEEIVLILDPVLFDITGYFLERVFTSALQSLAAGDLPYSSRFSTLRLYEMYCNVQGLINITDLLFEFNMRSTSLCYFQTIAQLRIL